MGTACSSESGFSAKFLPRTLGIGTAHKTKAIRRRGRTGRGPGGSSWDEPPPGTARKLPNPHHFHHHRPGKYHNTSFLPTDYCSELILGKNLGIEQFLLEFHFSLSLQS